jgi:hypothetical protein
LLKFVEDHDGLFAVIFTGVVALFTWRLFQATNALADVARDQAKLTETGQRAYLSIEADGVKMLVSPARKAIASIRISNVGKLPAQDVRWVIKQKFNLNYRQSVFPVDKDEAEGEGYIPPGTGMTQGGPQFPASQMASSPRDLYLYVWGAVHYMDGFDSRTTYFCHRYNCVNFRSRQLRPDSARQHRYGNGTDERPPKSAK